VIFASPKNVIRDGKEVKSSKSMQKRRIQKPGLVSSTKERALAEALKIDLLPLCKQMEGRWETL